MLFICSSYALPMFFLCFSYALPMLLLCPSPRPLPKASHYAAPTYSWAPWQARNQGGFRRGNHRSTQRALPRSMRTTPRASSRAFPLRKRTHTRGLLKVLPPKRHVALFAKVMICVFFAATFVITAYAAKGSTARLALLRTLRTKALRTSTQLT